MNDKRTYGKFPNTIMKFIVEALDHTLQSVCFSIASLTVCNVNGQPGGVQC